MSQSTPPSTPAQIPLPTIQLPGGTNAAAAANLAMAAALPTIKTLIQQWDSAIAGHGRLGPFLTNLQQRTGVPRVYLALGITTGSAMFLLFGTGAELFSRILGLAYPTYASFKTIKDPARGENLQWLMYWVVFAVFQLLETLTDKLLWWIPFYFFGKIAFLLFLQVPTLRGAEFFYKTVLSPLFTTYEPIIDREIESIGSGQIFSPAFNPVGAVPDTLSSAASPAPTMHRRLVSRDLFGEQKEKESSARSTIPSVGASGSSRVAGGGSSAIPTAPAAGGHRPAASYFGDASGGDPTIHASTASGSKTV